MKMIRAIGLSLRSSTILYPSLSMNRLTNSFRFYLWLRCMVPLFHRIAHCLSSFHFQVAERALYLWNNDHIESLIRQNRKVILPIIFPAVERNGRNHWNQVVQSLTLNIRKIFNDVDPELVEECMHKFQEDEEKQEEVKAKREALWKCLEDMAVTKSCGTEVPLSPQNTAQQTASS